MNITDVDKLLSNYTEPEFKAAATALVHGRQGELFLYLIKKGEISYEDMKKELPLQDAVLKDYLKGLKKGLIVSSHCRNLNDSKEKEIYEVNEFGKLVHEKIVKFHGIDIANF